LPVPVGHSQAGERREVLRRVAGYVSGEAARWYAAVGGGLMVVAEPGPGTGPRQAEALAGRLREQIGQLHSQRRLAAHAEPGVFLLPGAGAGVTGQVVLRARPWLALDFAEQSSGLTALHDTVLENAAVYIARQAARDRTLRVFVEGGGNGGWRGDAGRSGWRRAEAVRERLSVLIRWNLEDLGLSSDRVPVEARSRGKGPSGLPGQPVGTAEERRRVLLWVDDWPAPPAGRGEDPTTRHGGAVPRDEGAGAGGAPEIPVLTITESPS
jgi:hypothetical protein